MPKSPDLCGQLNVDYGTHVKAGQVMAVLEIPELQMQLDEDDAAIKDAASEVARARNELDRVEAQHKVTHLQFTRLDQVAKTQPGLVAQQEVDDCAGQGSGRGSQQSCAAIALWNRRKANLPGPRPRSATIRRSSIIRKSLLRSREW